MKKILIIGCSTMLGMHHAFRQIFQKSHTKEKEYYINEEINKCPDQILEDEYCTYFNLSMEGAGNYYIRSRLFEFLQNDTPDYVYIQFSGLVRRDLILEKDAYDLFMGDSDLRSMHSHCKITNNKIYLPIGNFVHSESEGNKFSQLLSMMYGLNHNSNNFDSLQNVKLSIDFLKEKNIKHNWTFYYDPLFPTDKTLSEGKINEWPMWIDLSNKLPQSPLNFAIEKGYEVSDGKHYGYNSFEEFLLFHKNRVHFEL